MTQPRWAVWAQVAIRWGRRLRGYVVLAANDGYLSGRVNFAMRPTAQAHMIQVLRGLDVGHLEGGHG